MGRSIAWVLWAWLMSATLLAGSSRAAALEGQADLDKATETKIGARTFSDLTEVIRLCESALAKGLDKDSLQIANDLLASTLLERARSTARRIIEQSPPDPNWPKFRRFALDDLEKATKIRPDQPDALYLVAQLNLLPGGDAKTAAKALDDAVRLAQQDPLLLAQALTLRAGLQKDGAKKIADLTEALKAAPGSLAALRARAALYSDQDKLPEALADLRAATAADPDHASTWEEQAIVLARMKKYDEALKALEKARKLEPKSSTPLVKQAQVHALQSNYQAALKDLSQVLAADPDNPGALLMRATVYQEMDEADKALADVDRVLELHPGLAVAMRVRTVLLAGMGRFDDAVRQLQELIEKTPDDPELLMQLAIFLSASGKPEKAIETYTQILAKKPDHWQALRARGDTLLTTGKHAEAIADFDKALKLQPGDSGILNNLAWVLATSPDDKLRNGKRAIQLATKACEVTDFKQAHILSTLAAAYAETGDFKKAIEWSEKAVQQGRDDQKEALNKELASYRAGKPWREKLLEPEPIKPEQFRKKKSP